MGSADYIRYHKFFSLLGRDKRHLLHTLLDTIGTDTVDLHFVLEHMETVMGGYLQLQPLQLIICKFDDPAAFGADHVIVMLT
jgi:hypothetical protein